MGAVSPVQGPNSEPCIHESPRVGAESGGCPHPPHSHIEEELLIVLDGEANIEIAASPDDASPRVEMLTPGQFSYYPAWQHHTIRNRSTRPVTYMMFKWTGNMPARSGGQSRRHIRLSRPTGSRGRRAFRLRNFSKPTGWLKSAALSSHKAQTGGRLCPAYRQL